MSSGQATLVVTPSGQSMLVDTGSRHAARMQGELPRQ
jgi:hypothetical protein